MSWAFLRMLKDDDASFDRNCTVSVYKDARLATFTSVRHRMPTPRFEKGACGVGTGGGDSA